MSPPPVRKSRAPFFLLLAIGAFLLLGSSCICCIVWGSQGKLEQERVARVGTAARLIALRDRLDRVHDTFPAQPVASACVDAPPTEPVVVLAYSSLVAFRRGEGDRDDADVDFRITSTYLRGSHRPANDIDDTDAAHQVETLFSPVRPLMDARWVAVLRTDDQRHPAVTFDTFLSGYYRGWLVVFDVATGRPLCAQEVRAQNSASIGVGTFQGGSEAAMADLVTNVGTAKEQARLALSPRLRLTF